MSEVAVPAPTAPTAPPDSAALHLLQPRLPSLAELGRDLAVLSSARRVAQLAWPLGVVAAYAGFAAAGLWLPAAACVALFFPRFGVAFHDLLHGSLGLSARTNRRWLTAIGLLALQSGHAVQAAHLEHHRRFPGPADPEAYIGRMPLWRALLEGPIYQYRMWGWAWRRRPRCRPAVAVEAALHVTVVVAALGLMPVTPVPVAYVALVSIGNSLFPVLSENFLHTQAASVPQGRTRTVRGRLFQAYFLELGYHLEHHAYPSVPTRNCAELARRLAPSFAAVGVTPTTVF